MQKVFQLDKLLFIIIIILLYIIYYYYLFKVYRKQIDFRLWFIYCQENLFLKIFQNSK